MRARALPRWPYAALLAALGLLAACGKPQPAGPECLRQWQARLGLPARCAVVVYSGASCGGCRRGLAHYADSLRALPGAPPFVVVVPCEHPRTGRALLAELGPHYAGTVVLDEGYSLEACHPPFAGLGVVVFADSVQARFRIAPNHVEAAAAQLAAFARAEQTYR